MLDKPEPIGLIMSNVWQWLLSQVKLLNGECICATYIKVNDLPMTNAGQVATGTIN